MKRIIALTIAGLMALATLSPALADGTALGGGTSRGQCASLGLFYNNGGGTRSGCVYAPVITPQFAAVAGTNQVVYIGNGIQQYDHVFWTNTLRDSGYRSW